MLFSMQGTGNVFTVCCRALACATVTLGLYHNSQLIHRDVQLVGNRFSQFHSYCCPPESPITPVKFTTTACTCTLLFTIMIAPSWSNLPMQCSDTNSTWNCLPPLIHLYAFFIQFFALLMQLIPYCPTAITQSGITLRTALSQAGTMPSNRILMNGLSYIMFPHAKAAMNRY